MLSFQYVIHIKIIGDIFAFCFGITSLKSCVFYAYSTSHFGLTIFQVLKSHV